MAELKMHDSKVVGDYVVKITVHQSGRRRFTLLGRIPGPGQLRPVLATGDIRWGRKDPIKIDSGSIPEDMEPEAILKASYDFYR
jgi:hypothetical protein